MSTDITLTTEQIPLSFCRCFQSDCPLTATCLRFLAGQHLQEGQICGTAVYPAARTGGTCKKYRATHVIRAAYGFNILFAEVKRKDDTLLRKRIKAYLGGNGSYYRYHHGERLLTPEQQEWILSLFRQSGYEVNLRFDGYRDVYDFSGE